MTDDVQVVNRRLDATGNEALIGLARMGADAFGYRAELRIDRGLAQLLRLRVSQLNNCTYCLNLHYEAAREAGIPRARIDTLTAWWETELHSEAEQAALRYTEALTRAADTDRGAAFQRFHDALARALQPGGDARDRRRRRRHERLDPDQACRGRDAGPACLSSFRRLASAEQAGCCGGLLLFAPGAGRGLITVRSKRGAAADCYARRAAAGD
jgi:AhpD family alkylhydroperoxidase